MRSITLAMLAVLAVFSLVGCTTKNAVDVAKCAERAYGVFQAQPRTYTAVLFEGTNMTITISNINKWQMEAPLNPLAAMPQDPDTAMRLADKIGNTVLGVAGIAGLTYSATRPATIVSQPEPLVVRPEVIQLESAAAP
ncbi:MAG: hypothetical protein V2A34_02510 [Lentisphaerota bacterium]